MFDFVLSGGMVVKGDGVTPPFPADIGIVASRISGICPPFTARAWRSLDVSGCAVLPGFVDAHSSTDETALRPECFSKLMQGITTEISGQCGGSPVPLSGVGSRAHRKRIKLEEDRWFPRQRWREFRDYFDILEQEGIAVNQATFAGWWSICDDRWKGALREGRFANACAGLQEAFEQGASGVSIHRDSTSWTGLEDKERQALLTMAARFDRPVAVHFSDCGKAFLEGVDETLDIAGNTGARLEISHVKVLGPHRDEVVEHFLERIVERSRDVGVRFDVYPHTSLCTRLRFLLDRIALLELSPHYRDYLRNEYLDSFSRIRLLGCDLDFHKDPDRGWHSSVVEQLVALAGKGHGGMLLEAFGVREQDMVQLLRHSHCYVGSDASSAPLDELSRRERHIRAYNTFPEAIKVLRGGGENLVGLARKLAAEPARWFGIANRGTVEIGKCADLVLVSLRPENSEMIVRHVVVNGRLAVCNGVVEHGRAGVPLRAT
jgi:N-acyl-D-amino-acid deacylase